MLTSETRRRALGGAMRVLLYFVYVIFVLLLYLFLFFYVATTLVCSARDVRIHSDFNGVLFYSHG